MVTPKTGNYLQKYQSKDFKPMGEWEDERMIEWEKSTQRNTAVLRVTLC
jgi:hypothetical protein